MRYAMSAFTQFMETIRGDGGPLNESEGQPSRFWSDVCQRIRQHVVRFEAAVRKELERFLEATRRGDGVPGAAEEERYVERLLEELRPTE
jgi:hypothetical protein